MAAEKSCAALAALDRLSTARSLEVSRGDLEVAEMTTHASFRAATGLVRPPANHGCPPVEVVPGLWTAHFHDVDTPEKLREAAPLVT